LLVINIGRNTAPSSIAVTTPENFGEDKRTRIMIFADGVIGFAQNTDSTNDIVAGGVVIPNLAESVTVEVRTQGGRVYNLPVEFAGGESLIADLDSINVRLIPELEGAGLVQLTLIVNGVRSNSPTLVIR
jgi:uncharacterized protein (TIGR03437 family)